MMSQEPKGVVGLDRDFAEADFASRRGFWPDESTWKDDQYGKELRASVAAYRAGHEMSQSELSALRRENEEFRAALEFYGSDKSWRSLTDGSPWSQVVAIDRADEIPAEHPDFPSIRTGGKRAREVLKKWEKK
jgi:hypothetical protein